jgi:hypothetical protein
MGRRLRHCPGRSRRTGWASGRQFLTIHQPSIVGCSAEGPAQPVPPARLHRGRLTGTSRPAMRGHRTPVPADSKSAGTSFELSIPGSAHNLLSAPTLRGLSPPARPQPARWSTPLSVAALKRAVPVRTSPSSTRRGSSMQVDPFRDRGHAAAVQGEHHVVTLLGEGMGMPAVRGG